MSSEAFFASTAHSMTSALYDKLGRDLSELFASRGWSLYKAVEPIATEDDLRGIIENGAAGRAELYQRYILLPATRPSDDPDVIFALSKLLLARRRFPLFVDAGGKAAQRAAGGTAYLIDSVMLSEDKVFLQVDCNAMLALGMEIPADILPLAHPCICFDALVMYDKIPQVTRSFN